MRAPFPHETKLQMLRRIPKADLPEAAAPAVRSVLAPEAIDLQRELSNARAAADSLQALRREFSDRLEQSLPDLVRRLGLPLEPVHAWLEQELARFEQTRKLRIHLHPSDAAQLEETDTFLALGDQADVVEFVRDPGITPGGCVVASEQGTLDARVETKLALVIAVLCSRIEAP